MSQISRISLFYINFYINTISKSSERRGTGPHPTFRGAISSVVPVARGPVPTSPICLKQDFPDYEVFASTCFFRSVRTCMSIETHVGAFSRSVRTLI